MKSSTSEEVEPNITQLIVSTNTLLFHQVLSGYTNLFLTPETNTLNAHGWWVLRHALANISPPTTFGPGRIFLRKGKRSTLTTRIIMKVRGENAKGRENLLKGGEKKHTNSNNNNEGKG